MLSGYSRRRQSQGCGFSPAFVCLSVRLSVYPHDTFKTMQLGSPNLIQKCFTTSPGNPFILESKGQRLRSRVTKQCRRGSMHSCERWLLLVLLAKEREYVFTGGGLCVCLCLSVTTITKNIVDRFVPNFMESFLGGKRRPSLCFVTIGRGMWK